MTISSGRVWSATQAYSLAVFTPPLPFPLAANTGTHQHAGAEMKHGFVLYHRNPVSHLWRRDLQTTTAMT